MRPKHADRRLGRGRAPRPGFTLLELMAALAISAVLIAGAWRALSQLEGVRGATLARREQDDTAANGLRLLRAVVSRAEAGGADSLHFAGGARSARFRTWCDNSGGWLSPCTVTLELAPAGDTTIVSLRQGAVAPLRLWQVPGPAEFRYVDSPRHDRVDDRWVEGITTPAAIAVVSRQDTLMLRVGAAQ